MITENRLLTYWSLLIILLHFLQISLADSSQYFLQISFSISFKFLVALPIAALFAIFPNLSGRRMIRKTVVIPNMNTTIRLADPSINSNSCSFPKHSTYAYNFSGEYPFSLYSDTLFRDENDPGVALPINFMSCLYRLEDSSHYTDITDCVNRGNSIGASNSSRGGYAYIKVGRMNASDIRYKCSVDLIVMTSWKFMNFQNVMLSKIQNALLYGFERSWLQFHCIKCKGGWECTTIEERQVVCRDDTFQLKLDLSWGVIMKLLLIAEITADCASNARYTYIKVGRMTASEVTETCRVEAIVMTSWQFKDSNNVSLSEIHSSLLYGFELTICPKCITFKIWDRFTVFFYNSILPILVVIVALLLAAVIPSVVTFIGGFFAISIFLYLNVIRIYFTSGDEYRKDAFQLTALVSAIIICAPRFIIFPLALLLFIYKFRRRHLSLFEGIESFLQSDNKLTPIRYSYSEIKKITKSFQDKLGEGGYGCVYKGKLRSGHHVAVKLLRKSGGNGQDFMNEIATIGRIHHVNVVKLVGYCAQGSKRALVFDFMPNGSLEKYLSNRGKMISLNWDTKFDIAVGIAQGIEYLHRGCDIQILHFDIKPHNILLDDKFIPKISDFGLAKFCSTDKKTVTMTAVRGTIGYVAPELISRSIGAVSYKADVYSFGMLLMELVGLNRDLKGSNGDSGQYFPYWIYDLCKQGKDIEIGSANEIEDSDSSRKLVRKMTVVALWCIQMSPDDRPSMNNVLQMLEGDVERLQIPECPSESTQIVVDVDESVISCWTDSEPLMRHDVASSSVEITVQE